MRRSLISAVAVLLLVGAAGCSSDGDSEPGGGSAAADGSAASAGSTGSAGSASSGVEAEGGVESGGSTGGGASGNSGGSASGGSGGGSSSGGNPTLPPDDVLLGADSLPSAAADHCRTKNLKAKAVGTGQGRASVVLTNSGNGSCTVQGFPSLLFLGDTGRVELPVDWNGSADDAAKVTLDAGESASAALTFTELDECDEITGLDVVPPGESRPLTPSFTTTSGKKQAVRVCDTGVRVTAFAPTG